MKSRFRSQSLRDDIDQKLRHCDVPEHSGNGRTVGVLALFKQSSIDPLIEQGGGGTVHVFTNRATDFLEVERAVFHCTGDSAQQVLICRGLHQSKNWLFTSHHLFFPSREIALLHECVSEKFAARSATECQTITGAFTQ